MLHDGKSPEVSAEPLSTADWIHVAGLLGLPPTAREAFERLRTSYLDILRWGIEWREEYLETLRFISSTLPRELFVKIKGRRYVPIENVNRLLKIQAALSLEERERYNKAVDALKWMDPTDKSVEYLMLQLRRVVVTDLAKLVRDHTPNRPTHSDKWVGALTEAIAVIDPSITRWMVRDALHARRKCKSS
jgi:hypothetical protein